MVKHKVKLTGVLAAFALTGCNMNAGDLLALLAGRKSATELFSQEKAHLSAEIIQLENAVRKSPNDPTLRLKLGQLYNAMFDGAAAELADWMDSTEGRASSLESIGRALSRRNHGRSRAVVLAHDHDEAMMGLRAVAEGKQRPNVFSVDGPVNCVVWPVRM